MIASNQYPQRFTNAINKLITSFFDGTLQKENCQYCAVGNMCDNDASWRYLFRTVVDMENKYQLIAGRGQIIHKTRTSIRIKDLSPYISQPDVIEIIRAMDAIESTGYSKEELARVEWAFETAEEVGDANSLESQFNGLMAVVDVLCDIEGIQDAETVKDLFKPKLQLA